MASDAMSSVPSILRFVIECLLWESLLAEYVLQAATSVAGHLTSTIVFRCGCYVRLLPLTKSIVASAADTT